MTKKKSKSPKRSKPKKRSSLNAQQIERARIRFWQRASAEAKFAEMWRLVKEQHLANDGTLESLKLDKSVGGIIRRPLKNQRGQIMPTFIPKPTRVEAVGNKPKLIDEYVGRVNSTTAGVSVAHMRSPSGWVEPGQTPEFDEYTVVLKGLLRVTHKGGSFDVGVGQAVIAHKGEWVQYSTPTEEGAEYIAVCLPAFSPASVHRDA